MALRSTRVAAPDPLPEAKGPDATDGDGSRVIPAQIGAAKIRELYEKGTKAIRKEQRDYWIARSYISGEQWVDWNRQSHRLETARPRDPSRVRITVNRLRPSSRTIMAKLLRRPLVFEVPPTGPDDESRLGARVSVSVLTDTAREENWEGLREEAAWSTWQGGTGFLAIDWDAQGGKDLGKQTEKGRKVSTGGCCGSALSITEVATEPGTRDIERARYWIKSLALPPAQVKEMFGLDKLPAADASGTLSPLQFKLIRGDGNENPSDLTLVLYYYERPSNEGKGQVAVVVGDEVVERGAWPFPFKDRLNLVALRETRVPGRWTGETVLSDAISPQTALNMSWSSIVEHMKQAGNARFGIPTGAIEDINTLTDTPGEPVEYVPIGGHRPEYITPPNMPAWWLQQPERLEMEIDDALGVHDISRGETSPGGPKSGVALTLLSEQDDTPLGRLAKEMAEGFGRFATMWLQVCEAKITDTRKARVETGTNSRPEVVPWTGKDLAGQTTAVVPLEAVQPRSRAAQMELATMLKGQFPDLPLKVFALIADLPGQEDLISAIDEDTDRAQRENYEMALGYGPKPEPWDNHQLHIAEHNRFRKSARFETLDPETQQIFELHNLAHEQLAAEEQARQLALATVHQGLEQSPQANEPQPGAPVPPVGPVPTMPGAPSGAPPPPDQTAMPDQPEPAPV